MSTTTTSTSTITETTGAGNSYREYALKQIAPPKRRAGLNLFRVLLAFLFILPAVSGVALVVVR